MKNSIRYWLSYDVCNKFDIRAVWKVHQTHKHARTRTKTLSHKVLFISNSLPSLSHSLSLTFTFSHLMSHTLSHNCRSNKKPTSAYLSFSCSISAHTHMHTHTHAHTHTHTHTHMHVSLKTHFCTIFENFQFFRQLSRSNYILAFGTFQHFFKRFKTLGTMAR